jgi:hypothetical protein
LTQAYPNEGETMLPQTIARLNDQARANWFNPNVCKTLLTQCVRALLERNQDDLQSLMREVASFNAFTEENDPHGEHDFGMFHWGGTKLFWKIDYYDLSYQYLSENPADPAETRRVLTVMLASEY